jgi:hypothetical protein
MDPDPDPGGPTTYRSDGFGFGSATLAVYEERRRGVPEQRATKVEHEAV